ncbi:MAG: hypothetical protein RR296_06285 [Clostridia bacterium]
MSRFVSVIRDICGGTQDDGLVLDIGEIQADKSLLCNTFDIPIPKDDYLICRSLAHGKIDTSPANSHTHTVTIPKVKPGDHVLVAFVGNDAVVVDVLCDANDVF